MSRAEVWSFVAVACAVAVIVALLLASCQAPLRSAENLSERLVWIESDDARQLKEFNHVDPALAALNAGNPRLILPHPLGNVGLPQLGRFPLLNQEPDHGTMVLSSDGLHPITRPYANTIS